MLSHSPPASWPAALVHAAAAILPGHEPSWERAPTILLNLRHVLDIFPRVCVTRLTWGRCRVSRVRLGPHHRGGQELSGVY
eukprot:4816189-Prymnesium_polylepis.1